MKASGPANNQGRNSPGWGMDADPRNNPTYPMRDISREDKGGMNWVRPAQQPVVMEVLKSTEHPRLTAVYGVAPPPSGLSGVFRRTAFRFSESKWWHWLFLLFADRINVVEGIFDDLRRGHVPNIFGEMGIRAELKHNKGGFVRKVLITLFVIALLVALLWLIFD